MHKPKIWLCGITSAGKTDHLKALIEPIGEHLNGLQWCFHYPTDDGAQYLEDNKGEGKIIYSNFNGRHGFSMTQYLWQGTMKDGDILLVQDDLERISPQFFYEKLPQFIELMNEADVGLIANYGKGFIYRYNEQLEFRGSPHWYAINHSGRAINVELEKRYFWNVRNEVRGEFQWVGHYAKYFLYPAGSNHALLGLEINGDPQKLFPVREAKRLEFRQEMLSRGFSLTLDGLTQMMKGPIDEKLRELVNSDKVWCDYYRYTVLNDQTVIHSHKFEDINKI